MTYSWQYPVYVLPFEDGYVSLLDRSDPDHPNQQLVVMTDARDAGRLMKQYDLPGGPFPLRNARELRWLLERIRAPISEAVFDPRPTDDEVNAAWTISLRELIDEHLVIDFSPWNYPVYVIGMASGFASVWGEGVDGEPLTAIGVFTSRERAEAYLESTGEQGVPCELSNLEDAVVFFRGIASAIPAVAIDPEVRDGHCSARYGFAVDKLLSEYLVEDGPGRDADD